MVGRDQGEELLLELDHILGAIRRDRNIPRNFVLLAGDVHQALGRVRRNNDQAAKKRIVKKAKQLESQIKKDQKYRSAEFICIEDYESCQRRRGKWSFLCALAFLICVGKKLIPMTK